MARASSHHLVRAVSLWGDAQETIGIYSSAANALAAAQAHLAPEDGPRPVRVEIEQWRDGECLDRVVYSAADAEIADPQAAEARSTDAPA